MKGRILGQASEINTEDNHSQPQTSRRLSQDDFMTVRQSSTADAYRPAMRRPSFVSAWLPG